MAVPVEGRYEVTKAGQDVFGEPLVGLIQILFATYVVAFL